MCILCDNWAATPHAARPTTDISCNTGHELMLLGYYLGAWSVAQPELPVLCPAHENIMNEIAQHKEGVAAMEAAQAVNNTPQENLALQQQYKKRIANLQAPPPPPSLPVPPSFTVQSVGLKVTMGPGGALVAGATPPPSDGGVMPIPPVSGIDPNFKFQCPNCKKMITNGEIHPCEYVP